MKYAYYTIIPSEASSPMSRWDVVEYDEIDMVYHDHTVKHVTFLNGISLINGNTYNGNSINKYAFNIWEYNSLDELLLKHFIDIL